MLRIVLPRKAIILLGLLAASSCASGNSSLNKVHFEKMSMWNNERVYNAFKEEGSKPLYKGKYITNTTIILGKRGGVALEFVLENGPEPVDPFLYHELFANFAEKSRINVCNLPEFENFKSRALHKNILLNYNCDLYNRLSSGNVELNMTMLKPFFIE